MNLSVEQYHVVRGKTHKLLTMLLEVVIGAYDILLVA